MKCLREGLPTAESILNAAKDTPALPDTHSEAFKSGDPHGHDRPGSPKSKLVVAAVTFLVSSGLLAVFGLITGEMYWDGYLSAFGLSADEFPATNSSVRIYAYVAVFHGITSVLGDMVHHWGWILTLTPLGLVIASIVNGSAVQGRLLFSIGILRRFAQDHSWRGAVVRLSMMTIVLSGLLLFAAYLTLCAWIAVSAPHQARRFGQELGKRELSRLQNLGAVGGPQCAQIDAPALANRCVFVVAYGEKTLAVLSGTRIFRVAREDVGFNSYAGAQPPNHSQPASAASL